MAKVTAPSSFGRSKIKTFQYGKIMKDSGYLNVRNLPAKLPHEGPVRVTDFSGPGTRAESFVLEYNEGGKEYAVKIRREDDVLKCEYCTPVDQNQTPGKVVWCTHLHYILVHRYDVQLYMHPGRYVIPIVPSEGIYCPVHVMEPIVNERNKSLGTLSPVKIIIKNRTNEEDDHIVIGYMSSKNISTSELRNMFTDWAVGNLDDQTYYAPTTCGGDKHEELTKGKKLSDFSSRFYPAMYGLCPPCVENYQSGKGSVDNIDDDAPEF